MTFSALDSALTGSLFASDAMRAIFSDRARIAAMLRVEAALAAAEGAESLVPKGLAAAIRKLGPDDFNLAALGAATAAAGVPSIPFVKALEAKLPEALRDGVHFGATSQDIIDTALALQIQEAFALIADDLAAILAGLAALARANKKTPCVGRTYGQHAAPITFGYVAATWLAGVAEVAADLPRIRDGAAVATLGGPVGTLAALGDKASAVLGRYAAELNLSVPDAAGHTTRVATAATGAWLALLIAALAKIATDVVFLSSTEVAEVAEAHEAGRGGSSAMPHKRNPIGATVIIAAHTAAPGLAHTLTAAVSAPLQRPAGAWHAEWHALPQLFGLASGALREARRIAEGLAVDPDRMRANLDATRGLIFADAAAGVLVKTIGRETAHRVVAAAAARVRAESVELTAAIAADAAVTPTAQRSLATAFDLAPATAAAAAATDRILARYRPLLRRKAAQ